MDERGLGEREVIVWWADPSAYRPWQLTLLTEPERERRERYRHAGDQARFTVASALLRIAVAGLDGASPERVIVDRRCADCGAPHGRPTLPGTGLHASISHSGDRVAVALTRLAPVGVDVEAVGRRASEDLAGHVLGDGESTADHDGFFVYWTRKEAAIKATGDGLRAPLREVLVSAPHEVAHLRAYPGQPGLAMSMVDLRPGPGYAAALAVLTDVAPHVDERDGGDLLDGSAEQAR